MLRSRVRIVNSSTPEDQGRNDQELTVIDMVVEVVGQVHLVSEGIATVVIVAAHRHRTEITIVEAGGIVPCLGLGLEIDMMIEVEIGEEDLDRNLPDIEETTGMITTQDVGVKP
jgi:hypothetical protein